MKRVLLVLLVALIAIPTFQSCKKGENDPISLKSRKARLVGEWALSAGSITYVSGSTTYLDTYNGSTLIETYNGNSATYTYTEKVEIVKDGTYKKTIVSEGDTYVTDGQWYFMGANEANDIKDKEVVAFVRTQQTTTSGGVTTTSTYTNIDPVETWQLDKLSSKEIIILINNTQTSGGTTYSETGTMTYTK